MLGVRAACLAIIITCSATSNAKYTKKLKTNDYFKLSRTPQTPAEQATQYDVPKFGSIALQSLDVYAVARVVNGTATHCFNNVYFGNANTACITAAHTSITGSAAAGFAVSIEGCKARVFFVEEAQVQQSALLYPDPWGQPNRCMQPKGAVHYVCVFPEDAVMQVAVDGSTVIWSTSTAGSSNAEAVIVAVMCVAAFAVMLPHSKKTTKHATSQVHLCSNCVPGLTDKIQEIVLADVVFAGAWSTCMLAANAGVSALLHPSLQVVFTQDQVQSIAFGVLLVYLFNVAFVVVSILTRRIRPLFRLAYESTLLCTVAFMIPYDIASDFHALFQFCVGATILFVAFRDAVYSFSTNATATVHMLCTAVAATTLLLPLVVDCDAVPATTELPVLATIVIQIAAAGATTAYPL